MLNSFFFITLSHGQYLLCVIWNSKSVQLILFKFCSVYIQIEDVHLLLYSPQTKSGGIKESRPSVCLSIQISTFPEKFWRDKANILTSQCSMTWFTLIGFESIGEIHSLKVMGNSSRFISFKLWFCPYEKYNCSLVIWFFPLNFLTYLTFKTGVKNAYITGMFCSDAGPNTILVFLCHQLIARHHLCKQIFYQIVYNAVEN